MRKRDLPFGWMKAGHWPETTGFGLVLAIVLVLGGVLL